MNKKAAIVLRGSMTSVLLSALVAVSLVIPVTAHADNLVENGDFTKQFIRWSRSVLNEFLLTTANSSPCNPAHVNNPAVSFNFNIYGHQAEWIEQSVELPAGQSLFLSFREWGVRDPVTMKVGLYDFEDNNSYHELDTFTAEQLVNLNNSQCTGKEPKTKSYDISQYAGHTIVIHIEAVSSGNDYATALVDDFSIDGQHGVTGSVIYKTTPRDGVAGVPIRISGTTTDGATVLQNTVTGADGKYSFSVPGGSYAVEATGEGIYVDTNGVIKTENGGVLSAEFLGGGTCDGSATGNTCNVSVPLGGSARAVFGYTLCAADELKPNGKPLTHCPIIIVPGFLGSKISCLNYGAPAELWPNLPFLGWGAMFLQPDGETNATDNGCTQTAGPLEDEPGMVAQVGPKDVYKGALDFLKKEVPNRWRASPYDWRKSPVLGAAILEKQVEGLLKETRAKHVVLYGHSMGGLVIREFLNKQANTDKVARIVTAGTPYWGAPKSHFALLGGYTDTPGGSELDYLTFKDDLQTLARNLQGLFFLYPSHNFPLWLSVSPTLGMPLTLQGPAGENAWLQTLGANPALLDKARAWHDANDGFPQNNIDYQVIVGSGTATTLETKVTIARPGDSGVGDIVIGNGDGTVPIRSATQGASEGVPPLGRTVPIHYICGVGHVDLPVNSIVLNGIRGFLLAGEDVIGLNNKCPYAGEQILVYKLRLSDTTVEPSLFQSQMSSLAAPGMSAASTMTLKEAIDQGLVQYLPVGDTGIILTDDAKPVKITLKGDMLGVQIRKFGSDGDGPLQTFKPMKGTMVIDASGQALSTTGAKLVSIKSTGKPPKTSATLTTKGANVTVKLTVKSTTGTSGTFYQLDNGALKTYKKAFKVKQGKKPVKISFYSVDAFGETEKAKKVTIKKK